jgi:hypothetical protein
MSYYDNKYIKYKTKYLKKLTKGGSFSQEVKLPPYEHELTTVTQTRSDFGTNRKFPRFDEIYRVYTERFMINFQYLLSEFFPKDEIQVSAIFFNEWNLILDSLYDKATKLELDNFKKDYPSVVIDDNEDIKKIIRKRLRDKIKFSLTPEEIFTFETQTLFPTTEENAEEIAKKIAEENAEKIRLFTEYFLRSIPDPKNKSINASINFDKLIQEFSGLYFAMKLSEPPIKFVVNDIGNDVTYKPSIHFTTTRATYQEGEIVKQILPKIQWTEGSYDGKTLVKSPDA